MLFVILGACSRPAVDSAPARDAVLLEPPPVALPRTELGTQILPPAEGVECRVDALVGADGSVRRADAIRSAHGCTPTFARAAQSNVLGWRFTPAMRAGVATPTHRVVVVRFDRTLLADE
jgi:hypothetical protein